MRPRDPRPRVRLLGADAPALGLLGALAQAACTHADSPPVVAPEPAPSRPLAPASSPPAEQPSVLPPAQGAVVLGADPTEGRVRPVAQDPSAPYYLVGDYRTRVGPRWYSRATRRPVDQDDAAFLRWLRAHPQRAE